MPFAKKFRAMMDLPVLGDTIGGFVVESIEVNDVRSGWDGYGYFVRMVLSGPGGQAGVRRALRALLARRVTTFSSYGNPYQLWFGKPDIESRGGRRYVVTIDGAGARIDLAADLHRFLDYLDAEGHTALPPSARSGLIETYLDEYRVDIGRTVERYRRRLKKSEP
jgi:hypothetical protein